MLFDGHEGIDIDFDIRECVKQFEESLLRSNLKKSTINGHVNRLQFFLESYLIREVVSLEEFTDQSMLDFLGRFYIHKVWGSSKANLLPYLTTLKKWASHLCEQDVIDCETYDQIKEVCKQKEFFFHRFDTYHATNDGSTLMRWMEVESALDAYYNAMEDEIDVVREREIVIEPVLRSVITNEHAGKTLVVQVFRRFMNQLQLQGKVKLTKVSQAFNRKFWLTIDEEFSIFFKPTANQIDSPLYQLFYCFAKKEQLFVIDGQFAKSTERLVQFQELTEAELSIALLEALWNEIQWQDFLSEPSQKAQMSQQRRQHIAKQLILLPVDYPVKNRDVMFEKLIHFTLFDGIFDVFSTTIAELLTYFSFIEIKYEDEQKQRKYRRLSEIKVTSLGREVFQHYAKQEVPYNELEEDPFMELINIFRQKPIVKGEKTPRNAPCPCGSGKKYKKCCID